MAKFITDLYQNTPPYTQRGFGVLNDKLIYLCDIFNESLNKSVPHLLEMSVDGDVKIIDTPFTSTYITGGVYGVIDGEFHIINTGMNSDEHYAWNGSSWRLVEKFDIETYPWFRATYIVQFSWQNTIHVLYDTNGYGFYYLTYSNGTWKTHSQPPVPNNIQNKNFKTFEYNNEKYVVLYESDYHLIYKIDGTTWTQVEMDLPSEVGQKALFFVVNGKLCCFPYTISQPMMGLEVYMLDGDIWQKKILSFAGIYSSDMQSARFESAKDGVFMVNTLVGLVYFMTDKETLKILAKTSSPISIGGSSSSMVVHREKFHIIDYASKSHYTWDEENGFVELNKGIEDLIDNAGQISAMPFISYKDELYIFGYTVILKYDNEKWSVLDIAYPNDIKTVGVTPCILNEKIYFWGNNNLYTFDGEVFEKIETEAPTAIENYSIMFTKDNKVYTFNNESTWRGTKDFYWDGNVWNEYTMKYINASSFSSGFLYNVGYFQNRNLFVAQNVRTNGYIFFTFEDGVFKVTNEIALFMRYPVFTVFFPIMATDEKIICFVPTTTGNENEFYIVELTELYESLQRLFKWSPPILAGSKMGITASNWNELCSFINEKREKKGLEDFSFTLAQPSAQLKATMFNEVIDSLSWTKASNLPAKVSKGDKCMASFFIELENIVNNV